MLLLLADGRSLDAAAAYELANMLAPYNATVQLVGNEEVDAGFLFEAAIDMAPENSGMRHDFGVYLGILAEGTEDEPTRCNLLRRAEQCFVWVLKNNQNPEARRCAYCCLVQVVQISKQERVSLADGRTLTLAQLKQLALGLPE